MAKPRLKLSTRRKALGLSQEKLASLVRCDRGTVARWERGENEVSYEYREPLASALQWSLEELDDALNSDGINRPLEQGWWSNFVTLEQSATAVSTYETVVVPGLLQIDGYAYALLRNRDLVARRVERQAMLTRRENPVSLVAVVDESVLHRPIGGQRVLAEQLRHIVRMSERPNITVQVLPYDVTRQPATSGSFLILRFSWPGGLVFLQHVRGAQYLDSPHDLEAHATAFDLLQEVALPSGRSRELIQAHVEELEK